jgi:hypothetical protein
MLYFLMVLGCAPPFHRWLIVQLRPPGSGPNRALRRGGSGKAFVVARGRAKDGSVVKYKGAFDIPGGGEAREGGGSRGGGECGPGERGFVLLTCCEDVGPWSCHRQAVSPQMTRIPCPCCMESTWAPES